MTVRTLGLLQVYHEPHVVRCAASVMPSGPLSAAPHFGRKAARGRHLCARTLACAFFLTPGHTPFAMTLDCIRCAQADDEAPSLACHDQPRPASMRITLRAGGLAARAAFSHVPFWRDAAWLARTVAAGTPVKETKHADPAAEARPQGCCVPGVLPAGHLLMLR